MEQREAMRAVRRVRKALEKRGVLWPASHELAAAFVQNMLWLEPDELPDEIARLLIRQRVTTPGAGISRFDTVARASLDKPGLPSAMVQAWTAKERRQ